MTKARGPLRVVTRTEAATAQKYSDLKEAALVKAILDAEDFEALDRAIPALLNYLEPELYVVSGQCTDVRRGKVR